MKTTGGFAWPCGAPSRTLAAPPGPWQRRVALGLARLTHGHHCAPASQMALDGIRRVMLHSRLCVLVFGASHRRQRLAPAARPVLSARVRRVQVYYFFVKTKMSGFFQTVFYFGYSAPPPLARLCCGPAPRPRCATHARAAATAVSIFCVALGVMCGTLGYCGCSVFVRRIYVNIKSD